MKDSTSLKNNKYLYISLGVLAIFLIWLFVSLMVNNDIIVPKVSVVFNTLFHLFALSSTYKIILFTLIRVIIAISLGMLFGIILGILSALYKWFYYFISPFIKIMRVLPIASIILIILIMFGQRGFGSDITFAPIIVSLLLIIPLVFEVVYRGITNIDQDLIDVAKLDAKGKTSLVFHAYLPLIRNEIEIALYQSIGLGIKVMVMAEYISQTQTSIGKALLDAKTYLEYDDVYAWTIILIVLCLIIEGVTYILRKRVEANK